MGFFDFLKKTASIPSVAIGNLLTVGLEKVTGKAYGRQTTKSFISSKPGKIISTSIVLASAPLAIPLIAKSFFKAPLKTAGVIIATPFLAGRIGEPEKVPEFLLSPEKIDERFKLGEALKEGEDIDIKDVIKGAGLVGAGIVVGAGLINVIPKIKDKLEEAKDILPIQDGGVIPSSIPEVPSLPDLPVEQAEPLNTAILPETVDITPTKIKKRKKKPVSPIRIINKNYLSVENYVC